MEEISGSSHHGQAEPAAAPVPARLKMSAGEIVKLLPSLSPGLSQALLRFLHGKCTAEGVVSLHVAGYEGEKLLKQVCEGFAAELEAALAAVEEGSSSDVIWQLSFCLLLALAPSLPNAREIRIGDRYALGLEWRTDGGEQAVEVLYSALVSQHWSSRVRRLRILEDEAFGTDRACEHLAHLLESGHCKLQQLYVGRTGTGAGGMRHIARALRTNSSLRVLEIRGCQLVGDGGVEQLAAMLRTNSTLEKLTLSRVGMTAHGLGHLCDALSTQQSLPATSSSPTGTVPNGHVGGLKKLDISWNKIGEGGAAHLGAMLAHNRCLRSLDASHCYLVEEDGEGHLAKGLRENSTLEYLDISDNPLGKVALGLLFRCLATNNTTGLKRLHMDCVGEMPATELAHMFTQNHSLVIFGLRGAPYDAGEWATVILPALGRNKTLLSFDMSSCHGVEGQQVRDALFDLLRINTTIREIDLGSTPLEESGEAEAVKAELRRNKVFRHALSGLPRAKPKSCRIVLCGQAYAGKSTLFQSMKLLQPNSEATCLTMSWQGLLVSFLFGMWLLCSLLVFVFGVLSRFLFGHPNLKEKQLSERTRGIEIHLLKDEEGCRISVWDLAGQREFHALHDFMFPSGDNAATLFVLTVSPIVSPADEQRAGEVKTMLELKEEFLYWLRFIASNSKPSAAPPIVVVVITHKDTLSKLCTPMESSLFYVRVLDTVADLLAMFSARVKVEPQPFMLNARASQDVELRRWAEVVQKMLKNTLHGLKEEPAICNHVLRAVQDVSLTKSNSPIISTTEFANICSSEMAKGKEANKAHDEGSADFQRPVGELKAQDQAHKKEDIVMDSKSEVEKADDKTKVLEKPVEHKIGRAVAPYLHDVANKADTEGPADSQSTVGESEAQYQAHEELSSIETESESEEEEEETDDETDVEILEEVVEHKIGRAVAAYLHDAGEVIYHDKLDLIVSNPRWFGHGVLGQLINIFDSSQGQASRRFLLAWCWKQAKRLERPKNGFVTRSYLSHLLKEAVRSVPGLDPTVVTPDQLIQLMLLLDLCYEQKLGDPNTGYLLPAIFDDEGNKAADGKRPLEWRELDMPDSTFIGRRLQCGDVERTFLTDGFFPRLQVVLHNHAFNEKWIVDRYTGTYIMLEKNLFSFWVNGMEILIEFSGSSGYFVDILVKSSKSHERTMEFLRPNIIGTIRTFCASQEGCQGVTLAEAIIRPECLYGAARGNPVLCTHRRDQSVLVEELTKQMRSTPDWQHCWDKVKDGAGDLVLHDGQDSGTVLMDGPKDVAARPKPNLDQVEETCYPNTWKQGKRRGLALIVSMEKGRPGGAVDRGSLNTLAVACGFSEVVVLVDPKASEVRETMNLVTEDVLEEDDCFLCSINAHGCTEDGKLYILDENKSKIMVLRDIIEPFRRSEHLQGKPKVFLINCCREGKLYDNSDSVVVDGDAQQVTEWLPPHGTERWDCLLVFSTLEGCPSCRDPLSGTAFVSQLMQTVMEMKETADVLSMMTMVSKRVNEVRSKIEDPHTKTTAIFHQCCEVTHTLLKKLYWKGT